MRRLPRPALLAGFLAVVWQAAIAPARGFSPAGDYATDIWTPDDGLPDSSVTAIAQTPDGYLWVGTYNGLARFDGVRFVTFDPANTPALSHARVRKLSVDHQGALWINTYDGSLTTFQQGKFIRQLRRAIASEAELTMVSSSESEVLFLTSRGNVLRKSLASPAEEQWTEIAPPARELGALCCEDGQGAVWYCDSAKRLLRLNGPRLDPLPAAAGLAGQSVNCLTTDSRGSVWAGTDHGLFFWDGARFQNATPTNGPPAPAVTSLSITAEGRVLAVADGCVCEADGKRWLLAPAPSRSILPGGSGRIGMQDDHQGGVWLFSYGRGLIHVAATGQARDLLPANRFPGERVNCFFEDREGNWWAGLDAGGLIRVRARQFHGVVGGEGTGWQAAKSVCEDQNGTVWVGWLSGGLGRWQNGVCTNIAVSDRTDADSAFCVCPDAHGRLWVSAGDEDLFVFENGKPRRVTPLVHGVKALMTDHAGRIWAGTSGGLFFSDGEPGSQFQRFNGIVRHYVRALSEDRDGVLWAGAGNGDLYRIVDSSVTTFRPADNQESGAIWSVLADKEGEVWVGTFRGGLLRLGDGKFTRYGKSAGLPDNVICQILDDGRGNLWLGSHKGIFRVAKNALESVAAGRSSFVPCVVYGRSDGLPSVECSGGYQPAAWKGRDGSLWFTTDKGAVWIDPDQIRPNPLAPLVVIEELLVDGRVQSGLGDPASGNAPLALPSGRHQLEFRYTGLSLVSPDRVQFRCQLEGVDSDWVQAGTRRFAQYSFVPAGDYRFRVRACNSDGVWSPAGAVLAITIPPHFYEKGWFRALAIVAVLGAVAGTVRYTATRRLHVQMEQMERRQAVERERARIAKDIHDDLGASLTLIAVLGDLAKKEKAAERIEKMSGTARQAVKSLDEIVWAVNPRNDTLSHLVDYTGQFATDYLRDAGLRCLLDVPEQMPARGVPTNVRHNVFLAVKEALQNIVKHAHATQVWLRVSNNGQRLRIQVEDNGCGFAQAPSYAWADGLRNMRQRLAEVGGECGIQSSPGAGTTITIELLLPNGKI